MADPLHKFGDDGAWVHVDSGFLFPRSVGGFTRVAQPYNIDGNNDAGAEYRQGSVTVELEIYSADSAASDATLEGAEATAIRKAGDGARVQAEQPFKVNALEAARQDVPEEIHGIEITFATDAKTNAPRTRLYYFRTDRWRMKVLASTPLDDKADDRALDEFVRSLPWHTLGSDSGLH